VVLHVTENNQPVHSM